MNPHFIKRGLTMVRLVPMRGYASTMEIHREMEKAGYIQTERTTQRDLHDLAEDFGLHCRQKEGPHHALEWTRTREV